MIALPSVLGKRVKRVGRGIGSGKGGHTTGRGTKGQKSRYKIPVLFEGVKSKKSLLRRVPFLRGKAKNKSQANTVVISTADLAHLPEGTVVTVKTLIAEGLVSAAHANRRGVKVVGNPVKNLSFEVPTSKKLAGK
jgi:large subunit ribosomal protein L15